MAGGTATEAGHGRPDLVTTKIPVGPSNAAANTAGDQALKDALMVVVGAWLVLFLLWWTLRNHNA